MSEKIKGKLKNESRAGSCVLCPRHKQSRETWGDVEMEREAVMNDCEKRDGWLENERSERIRDRGTHTSSHARPVTDDYFFASLAPNPR